MEKDRQYLFNIILLILLLLIITIFIGKWNYTDIIFNDYNMFNPIITQLKLPDYNWGYFLKSIDLNNVYSNNNGVLSKNLNNIL